MTTYEILLMLDPEQAEARQDEIVGRARELVEKNGGTWHSHDAWGRRRLAYPIAHKEEGVYHLVVFDADAATLDEVSRVLKIDDAVLRHLATRHVAGSRTSAPRDDAAAVPAPPAATSDDAVAVPAPSVAAGDDAAAVPAASATAVSETTEPEYAAAEEQPDEAGSDAGPEKQGEEE